MSFVIDHSAFMTQFAAMWDLINYHGYLAGIVTLVAGMGVAMIVKNMFSSSDGQ